MLTDIVTALRRELSVFDVILTVLLFGAVYLFTDDPWSTVGIAAGVLLAHAFGTLKTAPDVDERWVKVALGVFVTAGGAVLLVLQRPAETAALVLPGLFVLGGLWILLDARVDFQDGRRFETPDAADDLDSGTAMLVMQHLRVIADELDDGPKTVPELAAACDLTESRVRQAIDLVNDDGTIYRVDAEDGQPRYALDEEKMGLTGLGRQAAGGFRGLGQRFVRPFVGR